MKKTLSLLLFSLSILASCKKNKNQAPEYNINGSWVYFSGRTNTFTFLASDYPCVLNDHLIIEQNGKAMLTWNDAETCWINDAHNVSFNQPGTDTINVTYVRNDNVIYIKYADVIKPVHGEFSTNGNKLKLTLTDTAYYNNQTIINEDVFIKE
ncbi:hypothetical protein [Mucilaginibacter ginsenosidivorans]|uniref:Lipocalin-like domain-containing protein n=1 Tax=Mucilaginibacter ginsenosidivorans TaxID=398053 RepID=A0A5B8UVE2_9SPHI|nr:hypothetical protein [Mucilaginibacter ginsenosidivorans]QEC63080.1 hypothetical protein FRZ54_10990 [Mucilaginibacter ginsenosidivorans]